MNKKGFTLIELLAVIVILAIIALISVPLISGIIDKVKISAVKSSIIGYVEAVETQVAINVVDTSKEDIVDGYYEVSELSNMGVQVKGNGPELGTVTLEKGEVIACKLLIDNYTVTCLGNGEYEVTKGDNNIKLGDLTRNMLDSNTTYGNYTFMNGSYLKGVQTENYVSFGGYTWRIMGLNEDGTVRLITQHSVNKLKYGSGGNVGYSMEEGYIHHWMNNDFLNSLNDSNNIIKETEWCLNNTYDYEIDYDSSNEIARDNCDGGELFNAKVGLITMDEYNLSGASSINSDYYLINGDSFGDSYWTLTPSSLNGYGYSWVVSGYEHHLYSGTSYSTHCVRPVINISPDVSINNVFVHEKDGVVHKMYVID